MKTRFLRLFLAAMLFAFFGSAAFAASTYYVNASTGNDTNSGMSASTALKTIARARSVVSTVNGNMQSDINVYIAAGVYPQSSTLTFTPADSGTNGYYIHYVGQCGTVEISGGQAITGWTQSSGQPYFQATLPSGFPSGAYFRQLYVNGKRATIAGQENFVTAMSTHTDSNGIVDGMTFSASDVGSAYTNPTDLRLVHFEDFKADYLPVTAVIPIPPHESHPSFLHHPTAVYANPGEPRALRPEGPRHRVVYPERLEELNTPGEWYLNQATRTVYYYPRAGETLTGSSPAQVYAPVIDTLVAFTGNTSKVRTSA